MLRIMIACVGNCKEAYWRDALAEYAKRLQADCKFEMVEVGEARFSDNPTPGELEKGLQAEAQSLEKRIPQDAFRVALCIEGKQMTSEQLSGLLLRVPTQGKSCICFIIGGSFGLWQPFKDKCQLRFSFSPMTFPHQLARVMLAEQIYRGFQIAKGSKYHK